MSAITDLLTNVSNIGLDTAIFIYFAESHPRYVAPIRAIFGLIDDGRVNGHSTVLTVTETLTQPKRFGDAGLEEIYRLLLLKTRNFQLWNTTFAIADTAADLRARYNLRTPDAIQIATALAAECEAFVTNDRGLRRVTELRVIVLDDLLPTPE